MIFLRRTVLIFVPQYTDHWPARFLPDGTQCAWATYLRFVKPKTLQQFENGRHDEWRALRINVSTKPEMTYDARQNGGIARYIKHFKCP